MKKKAVILVMLISVLVLAGCSGVSQSEYDAAVAERDELKARLEEAETTVKVDVGGSFIATVRDVIPDYVLDNTTPQVGVVTLFQSSPMLVNVSEVADQLEVGKRYVFEIPVTTVDMNKAVYEAQNWDAEELIPLYKLRVSSVRPARDDEGGLDSSEFICKLHEEADE